MRTLVILSLVAWRFGEAGLADTQTTTPSPAGGTTSTPACGGLCKGLVGGAAGLAGLGAIGGFVYATIPGKPATFASTVAPAPPTVPPTVAPTGAPTAPTVASTVAPTVSGTIRPKEVGSSDSSIGGWLWPLLLGLLALCCLGALLGHLCMGKPKKATKRKTKVKKLTPAPTPVVEPVPEETPLMSGHYEQPMMTVPTTSSYMPASQYLPTVVETAAPVASYGMAPTVVQTGAPFASYMPTASPMYGAPLNGTPQIV